MANNTEELTKVTCELISDMSKCHDIDKIPLHLCYSSNEIQNMNDILLEQYISESNETESEVKINDCEDIKDYVDSGRADRMKKTSKLAQSLTDKEDDTRRIYVDKSFSTT